MMDTAYADFFAIQKLLQQQMQAAISLYTETWGLAAIEVANGAGHTPSEIPMHQKENYTRVLRYRSAIALKFANFFHLSATNLAESLVFCLQEVNKNTSTSGRIDFSVEVVPPGWIDFHLTDQGVATWLQHLMPIPNSQFPIPNSQFPIPNSQFPIQYAHARCCSLLRLGQQEGLITLCTQAGEQVLQVIKPNPIPWLNEERQLYFVHQAEWHLIGKISGLLDKLSDSGQNHRAIANSLTQAFETFYSKCRIFGEVKTQTPHLALARLGLVAVTGSVLRSLLQNYWGVSALEEL